MNIRNLLLIAAVFVGAAVFAMCEQGSTLGVDQDVCAVELAHDAGTISHFDIGIQANDAVFVVDMLPGTVLVRGKPTATRRSGTLHNYSFESIRKSQLRPPNECSGRTSDGACGTI